MKKYLIITGILSLVLISTIYAYFFVPEFNEKLKFNFNFNLKQEQVEPEVVIQKVNLSDTYPDTNIKSEENYKYITFSGLQIPLEQNFQTEVFDSQINIKKNVNEVIQGFVYPLVAKRKPDSEVSELDTLSNYNFEFKSPNNLPKDFLSEVDTKYSMLYRYTDKNANPPISYVLRNISIVKEANFVSYFFVSDDDTQVKVVALSKENLYIFNVKTAPENLDKIRKTFYNISLVK